MGFRFRKSFRIGPGVRLNLTKTGIGVSAGAKGLRMSAHSSGRLTRSISIPGTGLGFVSTSNFGTKPKRRAVKDEGSEVLLTSAKKPSGFSSEYEKLFTKGMEEFAVGKFEQAAKSFEAAAFNDSRSAAVADDLMAGLSLMITGKLDAATPYLESVIRSRHSLPDNLMLMYGSLGQIAIRITKLFTATLPIGSAAAALALVEIYQARNRIADAVEILNQLYDVDRSPVLALSFCDLLCDLREWKKVVEVASSFSNEDDATLAICLMHARALVELGLNDAAYEVLKMTTRSKKRQPELLKEAHYYRGCVLVKLGKKAQAKNELWIVYAQDPSYRKTESILNKL